MEVQPQAPLLGYVAVFVPLAAKIRSAKGGLFSGRTVQISGGFRFYTVYVAELIRMTSAGENFWFLKALLSTNPGCPISDTFFASDVGFHKSRLRVFLITPAAPRIACSSGKKTQASFASLGHPPLHQKQRVSNLDKSDFQAAPKGLFPSFPIQKDALTL